MKATQNTRDTFTAAIYATLTHLDTWRESVIYAEDVGGVMTFDAAPRALMPKGAVPWLYVEPDSFGDLDDDLQAIAEEVCFNMFEDAVQDTLYAIAIS